MPELALKRKHYEDELLDTSVFVPPEQLTEWVNELGHEVADLNAELRPIFYHYMLLGMALSRLGRKQEALSRAQEALRLMQTAGVVAPMVVHSLAVALLDVGRSEEALPLLIQLAHSSSFSPVLVHCHLSLAYLNLGKKDEAVRWYVGAKPLVRPGSYEDNFSVAARALDLGLVPDVILYFSRFLAVREGRGEGSPQVVIEAFFQRGLSPSDLPHNPPMAKVLHDILADPASRQAIIEVFAEEGQVPPPADPPAEVAASAAEPTDTLVQTVAAELAQLPAPLKLKHGPLPVVVETWSDGAVQACWPDTALYGEGENGAMALDALCEQIDEFARDMVERVARAKVGGPLLEQWKAFCKLVDVSGLAGAAG